MPDPTEEVILAWMIGKLAFEHSEFIDSGGEPRYTALAEEAADVHDLYEDNFTCRIPEWVFQASIAAFDRAQTL